MTRPNTYYRDIISKVFQISFSSRKVGEQDLKGVWSFGGLVLTILIIPSWLSGVGDHRNEAAKIRLLLRNINIRSKSDIYTQWLLGSHKLINTTSPIGLGVLEYSRGAIYQGQYTASRAALRVLEIWRSAIYRGWYTASRTPLNRTKFHIWTCSTSALPRPLCWQTVGRRWTGLRASPRQAETGNFVKQIEPFMLLIPLFFWFFIIFFHAVCVLTYIFFPSVLLLTYTYTYTFVCVLAGCQQRLTSFRLLSHLNKLDLCRFFCTEWIPDLYYYSVLKKSTKVL